MKTLWRVLGGVITAAVFTALYFIWREGDRWMDIPQLLNQISLSALCFSVLVWVWGTHIMLFRHEQLVERIRQLLEALGQEGQDTRDATIDAMAKIEEQQQIPYRDYMYSAVKDLANRMDALEMQSDRILAKLNSDGDAESGS